MRVAAVGRVYLVVLVMPGLLVGVFGGGPSLKGVGKNEIIATNRPCHLWTPAYAGMIEWAW